MALIRAYLPEVGEAKQAKMLSRLLESRGKVKQYRASFLREALLHLEGDDDEKVFKDLRNECDDAARQSVIVKRVGVSHEKASQFTPAAIKDLRPAIDGDMKATTPFATVLTWQPGLCGFQAYYPRTLEARKKHDPNKKFCSTGKTYNAKVTQLNALRHCVKMLWDNHDKAASYYLFSFIRGPVLPPSTLTILSKICENYLMRKYPEQHETATSLEETAVRSQPQP